MVELNTLLMFSSAIIVLLIAPGPNMAFVVAHGIRYGWRGGVCAALGIGAADLVLTALTAAGVSALALTWPPTLNLIRLAGACYLLYMAWRALAGGRAALTQGAPQTSLAAVWARSTLNSLFNPKALLFFLVFLPQFVDPGKGQLARQLTVLGITLTLISTVFHAVLGAAGGAISKLLAGGANSARWQARGVAALLTALAVRLALSLELS